MEAPDISGFWKGNFTYKKLVHDGIMSLQQDGKQLSATMTITLLLQDTISIVQETFSGLVTGSKVSLTGVNYSYVQRGISESYSLDDFNLVLSPGRKEMKGTFTSGSESGKASFSKQDSHMEADPE